MIERQDGQATVEAALTLPIVLIALLLIVQVAVVARDALALTQAAREGARAAAVSATDAAALDAVRRSAGPLDADRIIIDVSPHESERRRGESVTIRLAYEERLSIPIVSRIIELDLPLRAIAISQLERSTATPSPDPTPSPNPTPSPEPTPSPASEPTPSPQPTAAP